MHMLNLSSLSSFFTALQSDQHHEGGSQHSTPSMSVPSLTNCFLLVVIIRDHSFNRNAQHAANCAVCKGAAKGLQRTQTALVTVAAVTAAIAARGNFALNIVPALCLIGYRVCAHYRYAACATLSYANV
jgi:hypothetical protein